MGFLGFQRPILDRSTGETPRGRGKTTVRALTEEGLRRVLAERKRAKPFKLRKVSFKGDGLQPQLAGPPSGGYVIPLTKGAERDRGRYCDLKRRVAVR